MQSPANKTAQERADEKYDPEDRQSDNGTPKKSRKKKEEPNPGLTLGTDIEDHLKPDGKHVEIDPEDITFDTEKKKGQIVRKDASLQAKRIESLEASPPTRPISVTPWVDNNMFSPVCVASHARALAHRRLYLPSQMGNTSVCLDSTAFKQSTPSAPSDGKVV